MKYDIATHRNIMIHTQGLEECFFLCAEDNSLKKAWLDVAGVCGVPLPRYIRAYLSIISGFLGLRFLGKARLSITSMLQLLMV